MVTNSTEDRMVSGIQSLSPCPCSKRWPRSWSSDEQDCRYGDR
jgi:hypothetical protein